VTKAHPAQSRGIADLADVADALQHVEAPNMRRLGDAIKSYLDGNGSLDEAIQIEFDIRDNNERFAVARSKRNRALAAAAVLLPPGSYRDHARLLVDMANGTIPSNGDAGVTTAIQTLRARPLSLNQLEDILKRASGL
jgi:hypothetical protein